MYGRFAEAYARHSEDSPANAYYDRSAVLELAGDVAGKRVLELGSAAGALTEQLVYRGAHVLGLDREPEMVRLARLRLGQRARFEVADLAEPLTTVPTGSIDLVVASLVLHYLADWAPVLAELHRCLVPGGALVLSVHHPAADWQWAGRPVYLDTTLVTETWHLGDQPVEVSFYRRPLSQIFRLLRQAGFTIEQLEEPRPLPALEAANPKAYKTLSSEPVFLLVRAVAAR
ncbi:methyltransferase family protein [Saccharopolyspora erythraea NRRL 2338]|uniref:Ubiquinone/menaquinone biosynthesis methyltransferase n=2 Tax=Saccharopolyspora erythraea TaxID=1836 RepID=A4FC10_SACEN|nr:class I SAM-dependent methyltransferase [Saccharopolyspora erythraea]EQD84641.1 SAM-dependent methyltransferase [Saccharopolyspora erythraea D]PFG95357.1 methyltransferase family protein [Saccharopolyspora erythraea NRRL 2338]QRK91998.1 class I SAM-dependent methyltransferase [Saccharopolyspora erythraea]CAM01585.1 ubiquinone/menaquinone biosynthesis methyltransferase [Saccharopolyspora erythraea NRRL 2338]